MTLKKSSFVIPGMDCPTEEQMVRLRLQEISSISRLQFDLTARRLEVIHTGDSQAIENALADLGLGCRRLEATEAGQEPTLMEMAAEKQTLLLVLAINLALFLVELTTGFLSHSMGLVADSLDMLADAIVYGLSLYAVGHAVSRKKQIARVAGYFQFFLATAGLAEVLRRFLGYETIPVFQAMILISCLALAGNIAALVLLRKSRNAGAHMRASWIFTSNDVIANLGVILAGFLVQVTRSGIPDLIVGSLVFLLVARGAVRIYALSR